MSTHPSIVYVPRTAHVTPESEASVLCAVYAFVLESASKRDRLCVKSGPNDVTNTKEVGDVGRRPD